MGYLIRMPQMGMSMERGTVVAWEVDEGELVGAGDVLALVESEKTTAEVEAREDGALRRVLVAPGGSVEPGDPIGVLAGPDEDIDGYFDGIEVPAGGTAGNGGSSATPSGPAGSGDDVSEASDAGTAGPEEGDDVRATPGARRLADDEGVDLSVVDGTGPEGAITEEDVRRAGGSDGRAADGDVRATPGARRMAEERGVDLAAVEGTGPEGVVTEDDVASVDATAAGPDPDDSAAGGATRTIVDARPLSGMQRTIAERLGESYRDAVHVTLHRSFETAALDATVAAARSTGIEVSMTDLLIKAAGTALRTHPDFNALFEDGEHRRVEEVNVGVAVDLEEGLVTPVVPDVANRGVEAVAEHRRALSDRVRSGDFTTDDLEGGTFTVSNLGTLGVDSFDPIINPPEVAILGVGRARDDGTMTLSLSFDHRAVNGADAARFLDTLVGTLDDEATLAGFFEADVTPGDGGADTAGRTVRVANPEGFAGTYEVAGHGVGFDEPVAMGGSGTAPSPVDHLLGALGSCLSLSVRTMAERDGIEVGAVECHVDGAPDEGPLSSVEASLRIEGDADDDALATLVTKAERACYVERALSDDLDVSVSWSRAG